jgi:putative spermidine/putrescine transport system permease protein
MSAGSGWTFPRLTPDRLDFAPWRSLSSGDEMLTAITTSGLMSVVVGLLGTAGGLLIARTVHRSRSRLGRVLMYAPLTASPAVLGVCWYDLAVRWHLAGTVVGVVLAQLVIAMSFAGVFFSEAWSIRIDRLASAVRQLGGNGWDVWRHAVYPPLRGLIWACGVQAALFSWLDYGLVSTLGGGQVSTVTTKVFAYLREASLNHAAMAGIVLLAPPAMGYLTAIVVMRTRLLRSREFAEP